MNQANEFWMWVTFREEDGYLSPLAACMQIPFHLLEDHYHFARTLLLYKRPSWPQGTLWRDWSWPSSCHGYSKRVSIIESFPSTGQLQAHSWSPDVSVSVIVSAHCLYNQRRLSYCCRNLVLYFVDIDFDHHLVGGVDWTASVSQKQKPWKLLLKGPEAFLQKSAPSIISHYMVWHASTMLTCGDIHSPVVITYSKIKTTASHCLSSHANMHKKVHFMVYFFHSFTKHKTIRRYVTLFKITTI